MDHSGIHPRTAKVSIIGPYGVIVSQENCNLIEADLIINRQVLEDIHEALGVKFGEDVYAKINKLKAKEAVLELLCALKVAKENIKSGESTDEEKTYYERTKIPTWKEAFELVYDIQPCPDCGGTGLGEERMNGNEVEQGECPTCEGTGAVGGAGEDQEAGDSAQSSNKATQNDPPV